MRLYNGIIQPSDGNDGPDPLTLTLQPTGLLEQTAATKAGVWDVPDTTISFGGDGFVGPVAPVGKWGYKFDANSLPKVIPIASADGTDEPSRTARIPMSTATAFPTTRMSTATATVSPIQSRHHRRACRDQRALCRRPAPTVRRRPG